MPRWRLPSLPDLLRVRRSRWPLLVLLASIGLTAIAAIDAQRTVRSQQALAQRALQEYAGFAAWSYAQHLVLTLNTIEHEAIGAVNHGDAMHTNPEVPDAREMPHYLPWDDACMCHRARSGPTPNAFFAFKVGQKTLDVGVNTHPNATDGWEVDRAMRMTDMNMSSGRMPGMPGMDMSNREDSRNARAKSLADADRYYPPAEREWVLDSLTKRVRHLGEADHGFTLVVGDVKDQPQIFAYTIMPTTWGDTMVYGARYAIADFVGVMDQVLDSPNLLPEMFSVGRRNRSVLALRVRDHAGHVLFNSLPNGATPNDAHVDLPERAGLLSIDAMIRPELAGTLLVGGLPRSRLPFLLGLLVLAAAMSIVAVAQLRREGDLTRLRADFVSSVSHELRTPLAQIRLYAETLQLGRAATDEQRQWSLSHIERETTRLSHLVENVLRFSTLGHDDPTRRMPVDVGAEVARIAADFTPLAASRRTEVHVTVAETPPVPLRPDALRHIVLNLLDNAVKYGPPGQTVSVSVSANSERVLVTVDDEGPGVAPAERDAIWRPFNRGRAAHTNGGSGIGLTIVRDVVEAHGGSASVETAPGGGGRFIVALPFAYAGAPAI